MTPALIIQYNCRSRWKTPFSVSELQAIARAMLDAAGNPDSYAELSILDDAAMAALHARSLGCEGPTNVLSFPSASKSVFGAGGRLCPSPYKNSAGERGGGFIGWLALSTDALHRECFLYGQEAGEHCIRLLAHGMAHLLGHEHGPGMDALCRLLEDAAASRLGGSFLGQ